VHFGGLRYCGARGTKHPLQLVVQDNGLPYLLPWESGVIPQKNLELFFNFCMEGPEIYNPLFDGMHVHKNGQSSLLNCFSRNSHFMVLKIWICKISIWMDLYMQKIHKFTPNAVAE
jgi:hypothetical protein